MQGTGPGLDIQFLMMIRVSTGCQGNSVIGCYRDAVLSGERVNHWLTIL